MDLLGVAYSPTNEKVPVFNSSEMTIRISFLIPGKQMPSNIIQLYRRNTVRVVTVIDSKP
jgi:hypothetical protein